MDFSLSPFFMSLVPRKEPCIPPRSERQRVLWHLHPQIPPQHTPSLLLGPIDQFRSKEQTARNLSATFISLDMG